jgi:hypothetical protein
MYANINSGWYFPVGIDSDGGDSCPMHSARASAARAVAGDGVQGESPIRCRHDSAAYDQSV